MIKVAYNFDIYNGKVSDVKPTGKWRITNKEFIEIEVHYILSVKYVLSKMWFREEWAIKKSTGTAWLPEHRIFFRDVVEFDCNENK